MSQDPKAEQQVKEGSSKRKKIVLAALTSLLFLTAIAGIAVSFFPSQAPPDGLHKVLIEALDRTPDGDLIFEFSETRKIPGGAALHAWLEPIPNHEKVQMANVDYQALYALDGQRDWEISLKPDGQSVVILAPLPEFQGVRLVPDSFQIELEEGTQLSADDKKLAEEIVFEKMQTLAREDETITRRKERLESSRQRVKEWISVHLKAQQIPTDSIEVLFVGEDALTEEAP
jgi:hypothetical protein